MEKGGEFNTALPFQVNNILDEINILDELQFVQLQDLNCIFDIELLDVGNVWFVNSDFWMSSLSVKKKLF